MAEKIATLECTDTCHLVPCPPSTVLIMCKWVYKIKTHSDDSIERYICPLYRDVIEKCSSLYIFALWVLEIQLNDHSSLTIDTFLAIM
jgi:hypothetical protein